MLAKWPVELYGVSVSEVVCHGDFYCQPFIVSCYLKLNYSIDGGEPKSIILAIEKWPKYSTDYDFSESLICFGAVILYNKAIVRSSLQLIKLYALVHIS